METLSMPQTVSSLLTLNLSDLEGEHYRYGYDPIHCKIYDDNGVIVENHTLTEIIKHVKTKEQHDKCNRDLKTKDNNPTHIRIFLGSRCNFNCTYCKQHRDIMLETYTKEDVDNFVENFFSNVDTSGIVQIQFWGGEPLAYKKTLLYLSKCLRERLPNVELFTLSNGSLWTKEFVDEAMSVGLVLGISHDGPGQCYRTSDPLEPGTDSHDAIMHYWDLIQDDENVAFTILLTMTNKNTADFDETEKYFTDIFGEKIVGRLNFLPLMIDTTLQHNCQYDCSSDGKFAFRLLSYMIKKKMNPTPFTVQLIGFIRCFLNNNFAVNPMQVSCFMASPISLVVDMHGNIIPCQNYGSTSTLFDGSVAKIGHISDMKDVKFPNYLKVDEKETKCMTCPVVAMCMGGCPLNKQEYLSPECKSNFVFYTGLLAYVIFLITGKILLSIDGDFSCKDL